MLMNLRDLLFWRRPPIADLNALADFIDEQSAFLVQKGIYEYSRARAGHYAKVLFAEQEFLDAVERSRWSAYPLGLAMVGELVEGVLRPLAGADQAPAARKTARPRPLGLRPLSGARFARRAGVERCTRRTGAAAAAGRPASAEARHATFPSRSRKPIST